jgi:hypothetical protein
VRRRDVQQHRLKGLRVFSVANLSDFDVWLDEVEASAPAGHFELIAEVYGDEWLKPYDIVLERLGY